MRKFITVLFICVLSGYTTFATETDDPSKSSKDPDSTCSYYGVFVSIQNTGTDIIITCSRPPYPRCFVLKEWYGEKIEIEIYKDGSIEGTYELAERPAITETDSSCILEGTIIP